MLLQSEVAYKSLEPFQPPIELPNFIILSGLNGGGKSQLLVAISQNNIRLIENNQPLKPIKYVGHNALEPNNSIVVSPDTLSQPIKDLVNLYNAFRNHRGMSPARSKLENIVNDQRKLNIIRRIAESAGKDVENLTNDDFSRHYPLQNGMQQTDIFYQNFSTLFKRYNVKHFENEINKHLSQKGGKDEINKYLRDKHGNGEGLSDEEFSRVYGEPPWIFANKIIAEAGLDYQFSSPDNQRPDEPFELKLVNNLNGAAINFSDLSSGEKVIMSLALSLYNSKFDVEFPKVLLMDEPDSHLHPSMTKQFLDVIQNVFVAAKGVKVIMTTHSPSTVAIAPEDSLFVMNKTAPRIEKTTKDKALRILTYGVPTLTISYENRRQVFVESRHDVSFYEKAYEKLKDRLVPEISINFISSGVGGQGNCDQVKEIVNTLTRFGNYSIYGIIDWDMSNTGDNFVKVIGQNKRYSLENYIFDPILLAAFLLREKFIDRTELGLTEGDRYTDFLHFEDAKLQAIADFITDKISPRIADKSDADLQEIEYVNGRRVNAPSWLLKVQGHELEGIIKSLFPQLNRYQREGELKREIMNKVIDDIPEFIPADILSVFRDIQNYQA
jgi:AAA domain, putative AbiEii toxin, Type IV TA system